MDIPSIIRLITLALTMNVKSAKNQGLVGLNWSTIPKKKDICSILLYKYKGKEMRKGLLAKS